MLNLHKYLNMIYNSMKSKYIANMYTELALFSFKINLYSTELIYNFNEIFKKKYFNYIEEYRNNKLYIYNIISFGNSFTLRNLILFVIKI